MERFALYVGAAATTAIAGMLHLMLGPNNQILTSIKAYYSL
jgi:hypothetical protein